MLWNMPALGDDFNLGKWKKPAGDKSLKLAGFGTTGVWCFSPNPFLTNE